MEQENEDTTVYTAVINHEEQYSIWPAHKPIPAGWREAGSKGRKHDVLQFIQKVWTDMRPLSVRRQMEATTSQSVDDSSEKGQTGTSIAGK